MLISDWSSDVCSSDLLAVGIEPRRRGPGAGDRGTGLRRGLSPSSVRAEQALSLSKGRIEGRGGARCFDTELRQAEPLQIGKATCRERVCAYVVYTVEAVTLETTTQKKRTNETT